ncbi:MAG: hypothetical protein J0L94_16000 [Rhodothermia bacterium]|nr:hypothetical protein [Rhodothermia bacterium]
MAYLQENYIEILASYSKEIWNPLLDFVEILESRSTIEEEGQISVSRFYESEILRQFLEVVHHQTPIMIVFDWVNWQQGKDLIRNINSDFSSLLIPDLCKLITLLVRADRFNGGLLQSSIDNGLVLKLLLEIKKKLV